MVGRGTGSNDYGGLVSQLDPSLLCWRRSTYSDSSGGNCVEVARAALDLAVRDSKDPDGARLRVGRRAFEALLGEIRAGRHDV
ncbi:DUF397 domain-containing protein [Actinomadura graeca]|uniref:DUF397 domain-containing protein n=1 Tax=Actinomadura graeca TaxID=2750812 RepID=A0ABX8R0Z0_9ACTN|nr:DUF397 domain-containing protein [Actinomadura graeca]